MKEELIRKLTSGESLTRDERSELLGLLNTRKKYGIVWENKPEKVEERLRDEIPVLQEIKERAIVSDDSDAPNHVLIEGDNLHALTTLSYTHEGKIDMIYIDPPYNTGNKDFIYNDNFVDGEDSYRHSKWLSFMERRLKVARKLLSDKGVVFISIDDNEVAQLKMLCDEIFGERNFVATLPTIMNLKGNQDQFGFAGTHEYTLVYCKKKDDVILKGLAIDEEEMNLNWNIDKKGFYKKGAGLVSTGANSPRDHRPNLWFPLFIKGDNIIVPSDEDISNFYNKETNKFNDDFLYNYIEKKEKAGVGGLSA